MDTRVLTDTEKWEQLGIDEDGVHAQTAIHQFAARQLKIRQILLEESAAVNDTRARRRQLNAARAKAGRRPQRRMTFETTAPEGRLIEAQGVMREAIRKGWVKPLTADYWLEIGPPPVCEPAEADLARLYHKQIVKALERGGWSRADQIHLYQLEARWRRRATGRDARFLVIGAPLTSGGRLPRPLEARIKQLATPRD